MKHPALPFKICTKGHRLGRVGGGLRVPFLPFLFAPDQPQPQLGIFSPCGFHGAFLLPSVLTFVFQSMPFTASHTVTVISPPFPWHSHPDLDISHPLFPPLPRFHPGVLPQAWHWVSSCKAQATLAAYEGDGKGSRHRADARNGSGSFFALTGTPRIGPCFAPLGSPRGGGFEGAPRPQVGRRVRSLGLHAHPCVSCRHGRTGRCHETFCSSKWRRQGWGF